MTEVANRYETLTEDEIARLFEAGASEEFVQMAMVDDGTRNSVREDANRALEHEDPESVANVADTFGHFGGYLWDGNMFKTVQRADGSNIRRMLDIFGLEYINAKCQLEGKDGFKMENGRVVYK